MKVSCPICNAVLEVPRDYPHAPFCSARCKRIDLSNWFGERYQLSDPLELAEPDDESHSFS